MARYKEHPFRDEVVRLDGNDYEKCTFVCCRIQYGGLAGVSLVNNTFESCQWELVDAAARTIAFLDAFASGGGEEVVRQMIGPAILSRFFSPNTTPQ